MKYIKFLSYILAISAILSACDVIEGDYRENPDVIIDTTKVAQKILLEDYTGYTCGNCPQAHEIANRLDSIYKGNVIVVGIHAGGYAEPYSKHPYDFRTEEGNTFDEFFGNSKAGNPNGMLNRRKINNTYIVRPTAWNSNVASILAEEAPLEIKLTASLDKGTRKITAKADLRYIKASANNYICLMITEDKIVQYQKDYRLTPPDINEYLHRHVLRDMITPAWGELVQSGSIAIGTKFTKDFSFVVPADKDWNLDNLSVVAFVYNKDKEYEVLQAESKHLGD